MAGRLNYYFRQKVTEAELDLGFALLESADFALATDNGLVGIVNGAAVSQRTAGANLTVDIAAGIAYDKLGRRIAWGAVQNVDLSVDENAVSTAVSTPGSTKVLSIFAKFIRNETDPRIDGNGNTVYFNRAESFQFLVRQGAESAGTPSPPALDAEYILIADVVRRNPQPAITNSDIVDNPSYSGTPALAARRETPFAFSVSSLAVRERTAEDSDRAVLQHLQDHIADTTSVHAGTSISFASTTNWANGGTVVATTVSQAINEIVQDLANSSACVGFSSGAQLWSDGSTVSALTVEGALQEIIADLATQVAAQSGARKIGIEARTAWLGGRTNPASGLYAAVDKIITDLGATTAGDDGAERIGTQTSGNLSSLSVRGQLDELDTEKGGLALANTWSNANTFNGIAGGDNPAIVTSEVPSGLGPRKLLWQFAASASIQGRFYATSTGFEVALNCVWSTTTGLWSFDSLAGTAVATLLRFDATGVKLLHHNELVSTTWADTESATTWHKRTVLNIAATDFLSAAERETEITAGGLFVSDQPCLLQGGICATTGAVGVGNDALGGYSPYEHIFPATPSSIATFTTLQGFNAGATYSQVSGTRTVRGVSIENNASSGIGASVHWTAVVS